MRDHTQLRAFELADALVLAVYRHTVTFPRDEMFGLTSQIRRASTSIASNIVEGCARDSLADYLRFLDIAYGSAREVQYQLTLAKRLNYLTDTACEELSPLATELCKVLNGLIRSLRRPPSS